MRFHVLTLFPELIRNTFGTSITGRALERGRISLHTVNIRDYADNKHQKVDDYPYGGGAGMVMQAEPVYRSYEALEQELGKKPRVIYVTPQGRVFDQKLAEEFSREEELVFLCGHYEGIDERVLEEIVTDYVSIGDYVLTGGELAALVMMDAISRLVPGVLNNDVSAEFESFHGSLLEYPQYSRPEVWHGKPVPAELLSGNHKKISAWRLERSRERTKKQRPDLYAEYERRLACEQQLRRQKLLHMDMLESLRADRGQIAVFENDGIVLIDPAEDVCQVTADSPGAGEELFRKLEQMVLSDDRNGIQHLQALVLHQEFLLESAADFWRRIRKTVPKTNCFRQWVYTLRNPLPLCYEAQVQPMDAGRGAYVEGQLAGTLGRNRIGALAHFQVPENRRGQGIERALETAWVNQLISQGETPLLWLPDEDSEGQELQELQKMLGLCCAKTPVWVLEREDD